MSTMDVGKKQLLTPYLAIGGATFLVSAAIILHSAIKAIISGTSINFVESLIGTICFFIGLVSIIVMMVLIGGVHERRMNNIIGAIVVLVLFIAYELVSRFVPGFDSLGGIWGSIFILISYGVIRGIAFSMTNRALNVPLPGYGIGAFGFFGWSFLVTSTLSFLFAYIAGIMSNVGLLNFALILLIIQIFLDALCLIIIGINFIRNALYHPIIKGRASVKPVTTTTTTTTTETKSTTESIYDESKTKQKFCEFCGTAFLEDSEFCTNCGAAKN